MAEGKQYQVSLTIDANVDRAKKAMKQLQSDLDKLSTGALTLTPATKIDKDLIQASQAAAQLKVNLESAFNVKTGNLDLVKFNQSMKSAGMSAQKYQEALSSLGPAGDQAFSQLAMAVAKADAPFARVNSKLNEFATSLKNTAKWQISSSILHGLTGSINQAFSYAQQLNSSLNDIRIVTGASADEMAKFAAQANQAAKSLSTSTRSYADAALIFYQQGLGDAAVKERTDAVIKMANVTKDSAAEVSSYMTAIWNNFDDGSKSLEHYADVMTALGAATASSTAEIADGLEKFASIGKTIGLSYDYATSALATIVSQTRQSADTVGTGLRTIFSRLQGLSLGETLEDGVNLNKYSKALGAVGVSILDATGNMKDMDSILDSLASKWDNLTSAQKTALAQTVGGVRQYTTLISLMDNWDSMETNLTTAKSSSGALQEQANIYAESWDAAKNRVKASAEAIYSSLINDDFFIGLNNGFAGFLDQVNNLIEGLGGLKGVLMSLTPIVTALFRNQINSGIRSMVSSIQNFTPGGRAKNEAVRTSFVNQAMNMYRNDASIGGAAMADQQRRVAQMQFAYMQGSSRMTEEQRSNAQYLMQQYEGVTARVQKAGDKANEATSKSREMQTKTKAEVAEKGRDYAKRVQDESDAKKKQATEKADAEYQAKITKANQTFEQAKQRLLEEQKHAPNSRKGTYSDEIRKAKQRADAAKEKAEREHEKAVKTAEKSHAVDTKDIQQKQKRAEEARQKYTQQVRTEAFAKEVTGSVMKVDVKTDNVEAAKERLQALATMIKKVAAEQDIDLGSPDEDGSYAQALQKIEEAANDANASVESLQEAQNGLNTAFEGGQFGPKPAPGEKSAEEEYSEAMDDLGATADEKHMGEIKSAAAAEGTAIAKVAEESAVAEQAAGQLNETLNEMSSVKLDFASGFTASLSAITAVGAALSSVQGLMDLWGDSSASVGEKLLGTLTTVATVAGSLGSAFSGTNGQLLTMMGNLLLTKLGFTGITGAMAGTAAASGPAAGGLGTVGTVGAASGTAIQIAFWPIVVVMLAIAAAVALVVGVMAGIQALSNIYNADAIAAEQAAEAARNLASAYGEAQEKYNSMIQTMDNYSSARAALDSLTEGTEAYNAALSQANEAGLALINSMPDLKAGEDYRWENGELIIDQEAMDRVKKAEAGKVAEARAASVMADAHASTAKAQADKTEFIRKNDQSGWAGAGAGAALGATYGMMLGPWGAAIGGLLGGVVGLGATLFNNKTENDVESERIDKLVADYETLGEQAFDPEHLESLGFTDVTDEYREGLMEVVKATSQATQQTTLAARMAAEELLALDDDYNRIKDKDTKDNIGAAGGRVYQSLEDKYYQEYLTNAGDRGWLFNTGTDTSEQAFKEYAELMGLQDYDATDFIGRGEDSSVKYTYTDENGEKQEKTVTAKEMARRLAAAKAADEFDNSSAFLMDEFERLDKEGKSGLADFLGGDLTQSTQSEWGQIAGAFDSAESITAENAMSYLGKEFGGENGVLDDAEAQKYGYESAAKMAEAFKDEYNRTMTAWTDIELPGGLGEWSEKLSLEAAQKLENITEDLNLGPLGDSAGDAFAAGLNQMLEGVDADKQTAALNQLMSIDWSSWDALSQADAILQEFGVDLDLTSEQWVTFASNMRLASRSIPDFSKLKSDFTSISKIIGDLEFGEAIGEEEYQTLIAYNQEWSKFFVMQADGSRKFIGNAKDMATATREMALEQRDLLDTYSAAAENDAITGFDWDQELNTEDKLASAKADFAELLKSENGGAELTAVMEALGYGNFDWQNATAEQLKAMFDAIYSAVDPTYISQIDDEFQEMYASTATSLSELQGMLTSKTIDGDTYSKSLIAMASGYEYCTAAIKDYQEALASGIGVEEAQANLERAVAAEQAAEKYSSAYSNALSGRDSVSVADLNTLEEANPDLYYQYLSASEEEWYEASYQAYMAWLDARIAGYATDSAEYKALMAEKQQLEDEHYEKLEEKALKEKEQQDAIWEKQRSGAESALGTISSNLLSTDSLSFENIAELEATLRQAGIDSERIQTILANLNAGDSADDIKKKVAAAMEVAFAGMATDAEKAKEYNTLMSITDVKIDESVYQKLGDITKVTLAPDGSLISAYLTSLKQDPAKKTITFIGETGEEYTTTYTNCTADGSTRTITFTGTQGETYTTTFTLCTVGADKTITFIGSKGEKYTSTFNECTASGATKTITFKGDDGEYTTKLVSVTQDAANKTITFVGATGETYTSTYNSCVLGADKKITFTGAEGTTYTDLVTSCTAGANKIITLHGENGNYTTKYAEIVGGTPGSKTITLMLEGGAEGQQSALQVEVDKIGLNGKTITYTGDFGQIEEALKSYGLGTGDDGNVTMDVTGESGYTETAEVAGVQLAMGQLTFTTNLGTIQGEVDNLQADLASLPADYPVTVTLKDGSTTTITAKELQQFTTAKGVDMNAVVNYCKGKNADLIDDKEITVIVNYEDNLREKRAAEIRDQYMGQLTDAEIAAFDSEDAWARLGTIDAETRASRAKTGEHFEWDWLNSGMREDFATGMDAWLLNNDSSDRAKVGLQIDALASSNITSQDQVDTLNSLQAFIDALAEKDPELAAAYQLLLDTAITANDTITRNAEGQIELVTAATGELEEATTASNEATAAATDSEDGTAGMNNGTTVVETVADQTVLTGAAEATYTQATVAFQAYDWKQIGTDVVEGITSGINEGLANFNPGDWDPAAAATEDAARSSYLTHSPSRLMIPIGHDVVAGVETGIAEGLSDADTGDWTTYALATFADANGAFKDIGNDGIEGIVKNALLTDLAEYDQDASSIMTIGDDGLYRYNTSTILGQAFASNDENNANLNWYNKYGQFINTEAEDGGWSTFLAWHKQKQTKNANGEVMTEDEIKAMWDQRFSQMTTIDGHEVMNDYMAEFWKQIADTTVTEIEGISRYQRGVMVDVYNRAIKELGEDATGAEITAKMQEIINNEGILLQESAVKAWGQIKDIMVNGSVAIVQNEQAAAKEVYDAWVSTFEAISSARLNLMDKTTGSLLSEMKGDPQKLKDIYMKMLTGGVGWDTIFNMMTATGADKSQYMQYFNYTPFDLAHYKQSSNVGYLNWNGDPTNGFMGLNPTTAADFMNNINTLLAPKLTGNTYDFFQEYLTPEKLATMSDAEASVLMQKGIINKTVLGYELVDENTFKKLGSLGNDFFVEMLAQILGMDKSLFTYDSSTGKFSIASGKTEEVNKEVNELTATAMVDTSTANQQRADQITAENKIAIEAKTKELELLEKARDNGVESLDEAEKAQLRSYLGLAEGADLSSVSLDTLTGAAADAAAALGLLSKSARTDEYMALKGYTKDAQGNYTLNADTMSAAGYQRYIDPMDPTGKEYYVKFDANGNVIRDSMIAATVTATEAAVMATGHKTGDKAIDDAASGKTEAQVIADNEEAERKAAGFSSKEEQDDYIDYLVNANEVLSVQEMLTSKVASNEAEAIALQRKYANQVKKSNTGLKSLMENGKKWIKTLKQANVHMDDYIAAQKGIKQAYKDLLNLSDDQIALLDKNSDFFKNEDMLDLAETAAKGGEKGQQAFNDLQAAAAMSMTTIDEATLGLQGYVDTLANLDLEAGSILPDDAQQTVADYWNGVASAAMNGATTVGEAIDMANSAMESLGVELEMQTVYMRAADYEKTVVPGAEKSIKTENGIIYVQGYETSTTQTDDFSVPIQIPVANGKGGFNATKGAEAPQPSPKSGSGGSGPRHRAIAKAKLDDHKERYHEVDNAIDDVVDALERLNKQQDRAWGADRLKSMQAESAELKKQADLIGDKIAEAEAYKDIDLKAAEEDWGWTFTDGNVDNYDENWQSLVDKYNKKVDAYNKLDADAQAKIDENYEKANEEYYKAKAKRDAAKPGSEAYKKAQKEMDKWGKYINPETGVAFGSYEEQLKYEMLDKPKEALEKYEETMELLEDLGLEMADVLNSWYDNILEQIQYKLDLALELTENELNLIDYKLKSIEDNAYRAGEALGLMTQKMDASKANFNAYYDALDNLLKANNADWSADKLLSGEITAEDLANIGKDADNPDAMGLQSGDIEIIKTVMEGLRESTAAMTEQMIEGYETMTDSFESFNEELQRYISTIEHAQNVTSTYKNILDLTGRSMSGFTATMLKELNALVVEQAQHKLSSNKTTLDTIRKEFETTQAAYKKAQEDFAAGNGNQAALDAAKKAYESAQDNLDEAEENFLTSWEETLQAAADAFESNIEEITRTIGEALSGGLAGGLAELEDQFSKMSEQNDLYVDDYEKIYQLTKLTRDLDSKIDNTTNVRAQREMLKLQKEINGLLESDKKLSQYDIEYLQKKADLKMAEIAMQDAQNAKSQVTMRRDSEGNYNYVYTADEDAVEKAEQEYADKLYEMQVANDEYITTLQENMSALSSQMLNEIASIDRTVYDTEEKYRAEVERITNHYSTMMGHYNSEMKKVLDNNTILYNEDWTEFNKFTGYKISAAENYVTKWNQTMLSQVTGFDTQEDYYANFNKTLFGDNPESPSSDSLIGQVLAAYRTMTQQIAEANKAAGLEKGTLADLVTDGIDAATDAAEAAAQNITTQAGLITTAIEGIGAAISTMAANYAADFKRMSDATDILNRRLSDFLMMAGSSQEFSIDAGVLSQIRARLDAEGFDTGGYTGSWGSEGKLAFLHQKELVLNAEDTANMLASVGILRQIANVIDLNALTSAGGFISLMSSGVRDNKETLQQEVHIEAHFPNATDKNQIEDAFKDIVNLAAQYANRSSF